MKMISVSREIRSPPHVVWRLITQFAQWPRWGPTVKGVISGEEAVASGVTGVVLTPLGLRLPFVITDLAEGVSWSWSVAGVSATGHRVTPTGAGSCRLEFSAPWPFAPYVVVLWVGITRVKRIAEASVH